MTTSHLTIRSAKTGATHDLTVNQCEAIASALSRLAANPAACDKAGLSLDGTRALAAFLRREA